MKKFGNILRSYSIVTEPPDPESVPAPDLSKLSGEPDLESRGENETIEREPQRAKLADLRQDTELRRDFSHKIFKLIVVWLIFVGLVILLEGFHVKGFNLGNAVMIALITTTTGSVIGIFLIVARYLFPHG